MNIEGFKSQINAGQGIMRNNKFLVRIPPPQVLFNTAQIAETSRALEFWCAEAQIPGYQLLSHNVRRYTYGTNETRPFAPNFQPIQLTFISDTSGEVWKFFDAWTQHILPHDATQGMSTDSAFGAVENQLVYELSYKHEYASDIEISVMDETGKTNLKFTVRQAFPSNLNMVPLSWGDQNNSVQFTVFIEYLDWHLNTQPASTTTQNSLGDGSFT